ASDVRHDLKSARRVDGAVDGCGGARRGAGTGGEIGGERATQTGGSFCAADADAMANGGAASVFSATATVTISHAAATAGSDAASVGAGARDSLSSLGSTDVGNDDRAELDELGGRHRGGAGGGLFPEICMGPGVAD